MHIDRGSSSSASLHATPAGSEAIAPERSSQQFPTKDTPLSHLRNVAQVIDLEVNWSGHENLVPEISGTNLVELRERIAEAIALLEADERRARYLLPWASLELRPKLIATSALGVDPRSGAEIVQLSIVAPALAPGGHDYLVKLQQSGKALLAAIVQDRVDILEPDAAQVRRVMAILEAEPGAQVLEQADGVRGRPRLHADNVGDEIVPGLTEGDVL